MLISEENILKNKTVSLLLLLSVLPVLSLFAVVPVQACVCPPGVGTPGYWKNHPEAWPVDSIWICGRDWSQDEIIAQMNQPVRGNKWNTMFNAYVAGYLNVQIGNPPPIVDDGCCVCAALNWLCTNLSPVRANNPAWYCNGEKIYLCLDAYNNGLLGVPSRDALE